MRVEKYLTTVLSNLPVSPKGEKKSREALVTVIAQGQEPLKRFKTYLWDSRILLYVAV